MRVVDATGRDLGDSGREAGGVHHKATRARRADRELIHAELADSVNRTWGCPGGGGGGGGGGCCGVLSVGKGKMGG